MAHDFPSDDVYFTIWFPLLRNHVAHGRLLTGDLERTARLLLLDLAYVCDIVVSLPCPLNNMVAFLSEVQDSAVDAAPHELYEFGRSDLLRFARNFIDSDGQEPPPFYRVGNEFHILRGKLTDENFNDDPLSLARRDREHLEADGPLDVGLRRLAVSLWQKIPETKEGMREVLRELKGRGDGRCDWPDFLSEADRVLKRADSPFGSSS